MTIENNENSSEPLLKVENISKQFGYRKVLNKVKLHLKAGELTLLLGKNGAGKTTLLKIIAGLVRPTSGGIHFQGRDIADCPDQLREAIGVISHASHFYGELSAKENLTFFGKLRKIQQLQTKISTALADTGLSPYLDLPVKTFSSGMNKRLNIARLMVCQPQVLLLDEPYSGLDMASIQFFNDYIGEYKASGGTVLLITHQIQTCFSQSDNVVILNRGVIARELRSDEFSSSNIIETYQEIEATP